MSIVQPDQTKLYNGIAHGILQHNGSTGRTADEIELIRIEYMLILDRAKCITAHKSGWVAMVEYGSKADSDRAHELNDLMFISRPVHPSMIAEALAAIFED